MASRRFVLLLVVFCTFAATQVAWPQTAQPPQDPQRPPVFRTEANFVRVDVFATVKGRPVRDLALEDFEVLEDGVRQNLSTFEYVQVRAAAPFDDRREPNSMRESEDALRNPRARVFVLFLDVPHVTIGGAWNARQALVSMVDRLLGPEDLIGVMTPAMAPTDMVFARKTAVIEGGLLNKWPWGERHTLMEDEQDKMYQACYPWPTREMQDVVREMVVRRKERATLDAFSELVTWLREQREERKAIITVSEGWLLYRPNADLTRPRIIDYTTGEKEPIPGHEPIGIGQGGKITLSAPQQIGLNGEPIGGSKSDCDRDRMYLSAIDNAQFFRDIMDVANRANASFYTVDPRGLAGFDMPIGPARHPGLEVDASHLKDRLTALRTLAENTDGLAVIGNNNLEPGLRRISEDLSSYYLIGYYSSNAKLDGRFRRLKVNINRPGVEVRARRGYKAATEEEVAAARSAGAAPVPEPLARARAAVGGLARLRPEAKLHIQASAVRDAGATVWVVGELAKPVAAATAAVVTVGTGADAVTVEIPMATGQRGFTGSVALNVAPAGPLDIRVRVAPAGEIPFTSSLQLDLVAGLPMPLMFRRGPTTGNRYEPAGQPQFSRRERVRFDVPKGGGIALTAVRVLDRNGNPVEVPVTRTEREGWYSAEVTLAALGPGDYLVEVSGTAGGDEQKVLAAFRVAR